MKSILEEIMFGVPTMLCWFSCLLVAWELFRGGQWFFAFFVGLSGLIILVEHLFAPQIAEYIRKHP